MKWEWTWTDSIGLLISCAIATVPFVYLVLLFAGDIKNPVRPEECRVVALIAIILASSSSVFVAWSEQNNTFQFGDRLIRHAGFAVIMCVVLLFTFFLWWGDWALRVSGRP